jgi:ferric-dicitrate binding protein FerR (iron transport regulator)
MEKDKNTGPGLNRESSERLHAFQGTMKNYLDGKKLRREELLALNRLTLEGQGEHAAMTDADAREVSRVVWGRVEKKIIAGQQGPKKTHLRRFHPSYRAVAALLVVLLGIGSLITWQVQRYTRPDVIRFVADGRIKKVQLPDSSVVFLNVGSTLSLDPKTFNTRKRRVSLVGEAFFKVKKDPEKPFQVDGGELLTTVLGTSFDVKAYPGVKENVVSVRDGVVEVAEKENGQLLATLVHNQQVSWDTEDKKNHTALVNWEEAGGWITGDTFVLNSAGINEIILKARKYYGINLTVSGPVARSVRLRGSFPLNDHGKALIRQMCDIYGMKCDSVSQSGYLILYK